uniref:Uncharacterized protein n=1 Tax=Oryza barthii TaxID=65489 RepID=A0A0D3HPQ1_9ORYZ
MARSSPKTAVPRYANSTLNRAPSAVYTAQKGNDQGNNKCMESTSTPSFQEVSPCEASASLNH